MPRLRPVDLFSLSHTCKATHAAARRPGGRAAAANGPGECLDGCNGRSCLSCLLLTRVHPTRRVSRRLGAAAYGISWQSWRAPSPLCCGAQVCPCLAADTWPRAQGGPAPGSGSLWQQLADLARRLAAMRAGSLQTSCEVCATRETAGQMLVAPRRRGGGSHRPGPVQRHSDSPQPRGQPRGPGLRPANLHAALRSPGGGPEVEPCLGRRWWCSRGGPLGRGWTSAPTAAAPLVGAFHVPMATAEADGTSLHVAPQAATIFVAACSRGNRTSFGGGRAPGRPVSCAHPRCQCSPAPGSSALTAAAWPRWPPLRTRCMPARPQACRPSACRAARCRESCTPASASAGAWQPSGDPARRTRPGRSCSLRSGRSRRSRTTRPCFLRLKPGTQCSLALGPRSVALQDTRGEISVLARSGAGVGAKLCALNGRNPV